MIRAALASPTSSRAWSQNGADDGIVENWILSDLMSENYGEEDDQQAISEPGKAVDNQGMAFEF